IFRANPIMSGRVPLILSVIHARPGKPGAVHLHGEGNNHRMTNLARCITPLVDVAVPFSRENLEQAEAVGPAILFVWPVPGRPKDKRQRTVSPDEIQIRRGKTLFAPVT